MNVASSSASSSVAQSALLAKPDFHSLPPETRQKILGRVYAGDLVAFEGSQALRGLITPKLFNDTARNFIAARERTLLGPPWPSSKIAQCYAWVREQAGGSDEEFARNYPHAARLMGLVDVCNTVGRLSDADSNSRFSARKTKLLGPITCSPIALPSADVPAFPILRLSDGMALVTADGTISCPSELADCSPARIGNRGDFVVVNSMGSRGDGGLVVSRGIDGAGGYGLYRASTDKVYPLPFELKDCDFFAVSEDGTFVAGASWDPRENKSRLLVYRRSGDEVYKVTDEKLDGFVQALSVDSEGIALVSICRPSGACPENERYVGYEVRPGGQPGAPVRLFLNDIKPLRISSFLPGTPLAPGGYALAPGEDCVIQYGPERGDLTLQSRHDGKALILRPHDPAAYTPQSICMDATKTLAVVTYAGTDRHSFGLIHGYMVELFDLTSVSSDHIGAVRPKVGFQLTDPSRSEGRPVACLSPDASRLTVAYMNRVRSVDLVNLDLSPDGRAE